MTHPSLAAIAAASLLLVTTGAAGADWSDTSVGYRWAPRQSEPGVSDRVEKHILSFTHVSGDRLGTNFFTVDLLKSRAPDYANNGTDGAQELYGFYQRSWSLNALMDRKGSFGFAKDLNLTARIDAGAKNTAFAPRPLKLRAGLSAAMPVAAGFWDVGVQLYKESNHNGIVGRDVNFDLTYAVHSAWAIPAGPGTFGGFFDVVGPKGKDGFGNETRTEILARATYLFDIGGPKSGLKAGVGVEYWRNKFGNQPSSVAFAPGSTRATTPLLLVEYHF
jgi:hypothetical protein